MSEPGKLIIELCYQGREIARIHSVRLIGMCFVILDHLLLPLAAIKTAREATNYAEQESRWRTLTC